MKISTTLAAPLCALTLALGACSPGSDDKGAQASATPGAEAEFPPPAEPSAIESAPPAEARPAATAAVADPKVLALEGLGDLRVGQPVPPGGPWAERGAQTGEACRTVTSPDYPGVYAIVAGGQVRRITVGQRSDVKLVEGIGVGATERDVKKWFAGFRAEPHKYQDAPARYLTAPGAGRDGPGLRFEIDRDGKVGLMHVGLMPELGYVEGCS